MAFVFKKQTITAKNHIHGRWSPVQDLKSRSTKRSRNANCLTTTFPNIVTSSHSINKFSLFCILRTSRNKVVLEKQTVAYLFKKYPILMEFEISLPCSRYTVTESYCHVARVCDYRRGMDWILDFMTHLCTLLRTISNYNAIADLHNSQITTPAMPFSSLLCLQQPFPSNGF
jgi:hypothetical protein